MYTVFTVAENRIPRKGNPRNLLNNIFVCKTELPSFVSGFRISCFFLSFSLDSMVFTSSCPNFPTLQILVQWNYIRITLFVFTDDSMAGKIFSAWDDWHLSAVTHYGVMSTILTLITLGL
ncbi:hypothetical protein M758_12G058500 [Ceratodon purpureus]|nr:hypothetical protein M758_12G058500 [Ceratodon purpureus]